MTGRVIKGLGGFYTVYTDNGETVICRARGRFRKDGLSPFPGDIAQISRLPDGTGRLDEILPRRNVFIRPPVANLDALVLVASLAPPRSTTFWIDRILAVARQKGAAPILCFNKADLEAGVDMDGLTALYRDIGCAVIRASAVTGEGTDELRQAVKGMVVAFAGHSGVGKSSLLNRLLPGIALPVGEVSQKLGRGRHTTRHVELFALDGHGGAWVADTPGFSAFDPEMMDMAERAELPKLFPEFERCDCRFRDCVHINEKDCGVRDAVDAGVVARSRYDSYRRLFEKV